MAHTIAFNRFARIIHEHSGICLPKDKLYLVETRMASICNSYGCQDITELHNKLGFNLTDALIRQIVEALTTNETYWFRDPAIFDTIRDIVWPAIIRSRGDGGTSEIRVWCAACSTGQEPYTLRMAWEEFGGDAKGFDLKITATDLDTQVLKRAEEGVYSQLEVGRGLPVATLLANFEQDGTEWSIKPHLKKDISWMQVNLMDGPPSVGFYDIVMCRNVLIYFDDEGKKRVLDGVWRSLKRDGVMFLGGSESLTPVSDPFERLEIGKVFAYGRENSKALLSEGG